MYITIGIKIVLRSSETLNSKRKIMMEIPPDPLQCHTSMKHRSTSSKPKILYETLTRVRQSCIECNYLVAVAEKVRVRVVETSPVLEILNLENLALCLSTLTQCAIAGYVHTSKHV